MDSNTLLIPRDRPDSIVLDEMEFEIRSWDFGRELTQTQLAERLFYLARCGVGVVVFCDDPNLAG